MFAAIDAGDDVGKLVEVVSLRRLQWVRLEERNDLVPLVLESRDVVAVQILAVVVVSAVATPCRSRRTAPSDRARSCSMLPARRQARVALASRAASKLADRSGC